MHATTGNLTDEQVVLFFRRLKTELNCSSTGKVITQVRQILSKVKDFSMDDAGSKIPPLLYLAVADVSSQPRQQEKEINHLDELAETLYFEDKQAGKGWFKSEIDALGTCIVILKRIKDLFSRIGVQILPFILSDEVNHAVSEEAA